MADSNRDWLAITITLVSVIIAAASAGYNTGTLFITGLEEPKERIGKEAHKLPPVDFPNALFGKDEPIKVLQHIHWGLR
jgi:hypothetical protein